MTKIEDLTKEELKKVWDANSKLREEWYETYYEDAMNLQFEQSDYLLDIKNNTGFETKDFYNSFYFKLCDGYKFLTGCNLKSILDTGLITQKEFEDANRLIDEYNNITPFTHENYEDAEDKKLEEIDALAKEVLKRVEKYLHTFEDINEEAVLENFIESVTESGCFEGCYIKENEGYELYKDIAYTKCYV